MENQIETTLELAQEQADFRALLNTEILLIGGGEVAVSVY